MKEKFILALDAGTTSSRCIIFDSNGNIRATAQKEFSQIFPQPGWVEHDAIEIWETQLSTIVEATEKSGIELNQIAAIGITNQRETTVVWERSSGKPIYNAIVWQDRRTSDYCNQLKADGLKETIQQKTGLVLDAYFSATKLKWILDNVPGARVKAEKGELAFGTIDSWLIWKLTNGKVHATDASNASRTLLLNIHIGEWDEDLLKLFTIPKSILPEVKESSTLFGEAIINNTSIPIAGNAGDQQAALFGQMCIRPGMVKNTYGTGCFMLMNTGTEAILSKNNLLTTIAWKINNKTEYALEGSVFIAGAVVQWLRDGIKIINTSQEVEVLAQQVENTAGVYIVPAFAGLGAPYWNQQVRGSIFGLTRGSNNSHIAKAALDSIAYQTFDVLKAMEADSKISIAELRVDGGATINNQLMQFQSDILNTKVVRPKITETTALGAAYLAGLATGFWSSISEIQKQWQVEKEFTNSMNEEKRTSLLKGWQRAVKASILWGDEHQ
ncbi:MAG: glycerol kinase [Chitinophagaceae bacterium]|nr:MAG: glycerol kinase [Chitinophagaceae bacterium]